MATQVKHRRGTNAEIVAGTPAIGELWFNTTDNSIHMGDGVTQGGIKHLNKSALGLVGTIVHDTVATMVADSSLKEGDRVSLLDYASGNDSGVLFGEVVASGTGVDDGGQYIDLPDTSPPTQWKQIFTKGCTTFKNFGAVGNNIADDTVSIQNCINSGIQIIDSFGSIYRFTDTLILNSDNIKIDLNKSSINLDDPTGLLSHMKLGDGITQRNGIEIHGVTFTREQVATAGSAINTDFIGNTSIKRNRVFGNNRIHNGIYLKRAIITHITDENYIDNCVNKQIEIIGTDSGANRTIDVTLSGNRIEGGQAGVSIYDFVEGLFMKENIIFNTQGSGLEINASTNANGLVSFKIIENDFDTCGGNGAFIDKISNIQFNGNWFSNNTGDDLILGADVDGIVVDGNQLYPNTVGMVVSCNSAVITDNLISGGTDNIQVGSSATNTSVASNTLSNAQRGVNITGATDDLKISDNNIFNMSVSPISGENLATNADIRNNKGDAPVGGSSFIAVGASPFTYTAGPRPEQVSISSGTVSQIDIGGNAVGFTSERSFNLPPGGQMIVTYSSVPFMVKILQ